MTAVEIASPFALGIVSSLHCAQMCGPIVVSYSLGSRPSIAGHLSYNAGRILTYSGLGAVAGTVGRGLNLAGPERVTALLCGVLMIVAGIFMTGALPRRALVQVDRLGFSKVYSRTIGRLMCASGSRNQLALGLLMGFLPCGLLYAALLQAGSTGSGGAGALSMAAFGMGTSGTLLAIGLFSSAIRFRLDRWSNLLAAAGVVAMGLVLVWRGWVAAMPGMMHHAGM